MDPVDPHVHVFRLGQRPLAERVRLVAPLRREAGDGRLGQASGRAEELLQRGHEVPAGQAVQVEQREHLGHARGLLRPRGQDRRGELLALPGGLVEALVVDPRLTHRDRPGRGCDLPRVVEAVADHQPVSVLVDLSRMGLDVGGATSASSAAASICRAPSRASSSSNDPPTPAGTCCWDWFSSWTTLSMDVPSRAGAPTPTSIRT